MFAIIFSLMISNVNALTKACPDYEFASKLLDTKYLVSLSKERLAKAERREKDKNGVPIKREISVDFLDQNQAKEFAFRLPALKDFGFVEDVNATRGAHISRLEVSSLHGMQTGRKFTSASGDKATIRLDWDETKGAHYNVEITKHTPSGKESHRLALKFKCGDRDCTEAQVKKMAERDY